MLEPTCWGSESLLRPLTSDLRGVYAVGNFGARFSAIVKGLTVQEWGINNSLLQFTVAINDSSRE